MLPSCPAFYACFAASIAFMVSQFLPGHLPPPRCSSAARNGLLLLNLLLCNHHTLGDQIITRELRDTLFRHSGIAPGTEPMPTTRTILMMLLNRYSEPPGSPECAGTIVEGWFCRGITQCQPGLCISSLLERYEETSGNEQALCSS